MTRGSGAFAIAFGIVASLSCPAQESVAPPGPGGPLSQLAPAAREIARCGWTAEAEALVGAMRELGYEQQRADTLLATCRKDAAGRPRRPVPDDVRASVRLAAQRLAGVIDDAGGEPARNAAEVVLSIDSKIERLHLLLGHERSLSGWRTKEQQQAAARKREIHLALMKARRLRPVLTTSEDRDPVFTALRASTCTKTVGHGVTVWSPWSAAKATRVLTETLRAAAVASYLVKGTLEIPRFKQNFLLLDTRKDYDQAIDICRSRGWLDEDAAKYARTLTGFSTQRRELSPYLISFDQTESQAEAGLLFEMCRELGVRELCPPLSVGFVNWVCLAYLGTPMPGVAWEEMGGWKNRRTLANLRPGEEAERESVLKLSQAGISGTRAWLTYLAARGEDPKFSQSVLDEEGKITGNDRLKCTFVVEFLNEHNELLSLGEKTRIGTREAFEQVWGTSFAAFEERWKLWLLGSPPSILDRLERAKPPCVLPAEVELVLRLNDLRRRCFEGSVCGDNKPARSGVSTAELAGFDAVEIDASLSEGAAKHARYLKKNSSQLRAWPDAHEEWPDRPEYSTEGSRAGMNAVIVPGVSTPDAALTAWLGTFYHRLPLLHPGLMRVGWASNDQLSVLDTGSLTMPVFGSWHVVWPYHGMTDVPRMFEPELPPPVPGAEGLLGYAVTLQVGAQSADESPPSIVLELREGTPAGPKVECRLSSPSQPSNPDVAVTDAWCLIPMAPLKRLTTYHASADWSTGRRIEWSFKTGKQFVPKPVDDELGSHPR